MQEKNLDKYLKMTGWNPDKCWSSEANVFGKVFPQNVESKHVAAFIELILKTRNTLDKMVVRLEDDPKGRCFEELLHMVPMLTNEHNVAIVLNQAEQEEFSFSMKFHS